MILVDGSNLTLSFQGRKIFDEVSVTVAKNDRIGIVGQNGAGKSTLLKLLAGEIKPDQGEIRKPKNVAISALAQQRDFGSQTIEEAFAGSWQIASILQRLGLGARFDTRIDQLSGGEARRVALGAALVAESDLLFLDEPTNHLDIDAIAWLEEQLSFHRGGLVVVSHDRHLLDAVTSQIIEVDQAKLYRHDGGYRGYLEGRALRLAQAEDAESRRRNLAKKEAAWLARGAPARTRKPKAHIARAEAIQISNKTHSVRDHNLVLHSETPRLGNTVIELDGVSHQIGGRTLFNDVSLKLDPRERLAIIGPNGSGKTTLLNLLAQRLAPQTGEIRVGSTVRIAYFDQLGKDLDPNARVIDLFTDGGREPDYRDKALLEKFWFAPETQYNSVSRLSGGERRRLQLVLTLAEMPNVLFCDEPTNDLDLDTLRALEDFLEDWPGALVTVSHDRAFLERVAVDVMVIDEGTELKRVPGGLAAWIDQRRSQRKRGHTAQSSSKSASESQSSKTTKSASDSKPASKSTLRHRLKTLDKQLQKANSLVESLCEEIENCTDHERLSEIGARLHVAQNELSEIEESWIETADALEALQ